MTLGQVSEVVPGVEAGGVGVVPGDPDGVAANRFEGLDTEVGADGGGVEDAGAGPFVLARGAGTLTSDEVIRNPRGAEIGPGEFEGLIVLMGADVGGWVAHGW